MEQKQLDHSEWTGVIPATPKGSIRHEQGYKEAKLLDHSEWTGIIPGSPMDIDAIVTNHRKGNILIMELKHCWEAPNGFGSLNSGQLLTLRDCVDAGAGRTTAVLLKHIKPENRHIRTISDVISFEVMRYRTPGRVKTSGLLNAGEDGSIWAEFIKQWWQCGKTLTQVEVDNEGSR